MSIILPATDEPRSLTETVRRIRKLLPEYRLQLIVVTHPKLTTPACREAISELQKEYPTEVETFDQKNPGLGSAVQEAFARSRGTYTALMSADLETDPAVLPLMLQEVGNGADIAVTTRWRRGARFKGYDPLKFVLNFIFQQIFRLLYWTPLSDLTYAYRIYCTPIVRAIRWEESGFPFLFESILKPLRLGYKVAEVDAPWIARTEGVSHNSFKQTFSYTWVGFRVRFQRKAKMIYTVAQ